MFVITPEKGIVMTMFLFAVLLWDGTLSPSLCTLSRTPLARDEIVFVRMQFVVTD